jgi:hypothetical protein
MIRLRCSLAGLSGSLVSDIAPFGHSIDDLIEINYLRLLGGTVGLNRRTPCLGAVKTSATLLDWS